MNEEQAKTVTNPGGAPGEGRLSTLERLEVGQLIDDRYKILSVIGEGGHGVVYRVEQVFLGKDVALKTLDRRHENQTILRRFQQEAKAASALDHPSLIKVLDFGVLDNERPFLVMELIEGETLSQYLKRKGVLTPQELLPLFISICEGLSYAHERGIVHRDIKPSNIMLLDGTDSSRTVKIVDFGIAKLSHDDGEIQALTRTGEIFGSPLYMSPEQCLGTRTDNRADIYSLGCVMYEALTGSPPFVADTAMQTMMKHTSEVPASLTQASMGRRVPAELENIIMKMLSKRPEDRYQHALMIAEDLRRLDLTEPDRSNLSLTPGFRPGVNKKKGGTVLLFAAALAAGMVSGYVLSVLTVKPVVVEKIVQPKPVEQIDYSQEPMPFMPISHVYTDVNGKKMRRWHFPRQLGTLTTLDGRNINEEFFDLPVEERLCLNASVTAELSGNIFAGLDSGSLASLVVSKRIVDDAFMQSISHLKSLSSVNFDYSSVCGRHIQYLSQLPKLHSLSLKATDVTGQDILRLKQLRQLGGLTLSNLEHGSQLVDELSKNNSLLSLALENSGLTDADLVKMAQFKKIFTLCLAENPGITDAGLKHLLALPNLNGLNVRRCSITPESAAILKGLPKLLNLQVGIDDWRPEDVRAFEKEIKEQMPACNIAFYKGLTAVKSDEAERDVRKEQAELLDSLINTK